MRNGILALCFLLAIQPVHSATVRVPQDAPTIQAGINAAQSGDTVLVAPGRYREQVIVDKGGVTLSGAGATLDGSEPITGWTRDTANPNLWKVTLALTPSAGADAAYTANLYQGSRLLLMAQEPNPPDWVYFSDDIDSMFEALPANASQTTITDSRLAQWGNALIGGYAIAWTTGNQTAVRPITAYSNNRITFTAMPTSTYPDRPTKWAVANALPLLDIPGEYYISPADATGKRTITLWPLDGADPNAANITRTVKSYAIQVGGVAGVVIDGFVIEKFGGAAIWSNSSSRVLNLAIRNVEARYGKPSSSGNVIDLRQADGAVVEDNYIHDYIRSRAIIIAGVPSSTNATVRRNRIEFVGGTGIYFGGVKTGAIEENRLADNRGQHGNGLTAYQDSQDITIARNIVERSNIALTIEASRRIKTVNNLLLGGNQHSIAVWSVSPTAMDLHFWHNTMDSSFVIIPSATTGSIKNNIAKLISVGGALERGHNIITWPDANLPWNQSPLTSTEFRVRDTTALFTDGYRLIETSPAVNAGADLGVMVDLAGTVRSAPDIGAYEFTAATPTPSPSPSPTPSPTPSPSPTPTPGPTPSPTPFPTPEPTPTPEPPLAPCYPPEMDIQTGDVILIAMTDGSPWPYIVTVGTSVTLKRASKGTVAVSSWVYASTRDVFTALSADGTRTRQLILGPKQGITKTSYYTKRVENE